MLKALTIQDLAVVRHLDVEFESGLTILTGETGAGKSILIEALGLALGDRADSSMVRTNSDRASVSASFDIAGNHALLALLKENDLEDGTECILRRVLNADGRSRAFCNAAPIPVQLLKQIGECLVDIHGQHAHHSLLRREVMRELLDEFAGNEKQLTDVSRYHGEWRDIQQRLNELNDGASDVASRLELLRFQVEELETLGLTVERLDTLEAEHRRIGAASELGDACDVASVAAFGDDGALKGIVAATQSLRAVASLDPAIASVADMLDSAAIDLEEAERELNQVRSTINSDPQQLQSLDRELATIQDLARKHRCEPREIPERLTTIQQALAELGDREGTIQALETALVEAAANYEKSARNLSKRRRKAAKTLAVAITARIRELGIPHGEFAVDVESTEGMPRASGLDTIEFLVSANPDQSPKPMRKVASGGELSRISLAIQVTTTSSSGVPVLVFDEVDTGIGGPTADVVSRYLSELAAHRQILCITHLPQVASGGNHHLVIGKIVTSGITETTIQSLDAEQRVEEIARMLGGQRITDKAREHARELLTS